MALAKRSYSLTRLHWETRGQVELYMKRQSKWLVWKWLKRPLPIWKDEVGMIYIPSMGELERAVEVSFDLLEEWQTKKAGDESQRIITRLLLTDTASLTFTRPEKREIRKWLKRAPISQRQMNLVQAWEFTMGLSPSLDWKLMTGMCWILKFSSFAQREMLLFSRVPEWAR